MTSITDREINAFLGVSTRTGKLAYVGMDGRPLVTPVWFVVEGSCIVFNTFRKSAKARGAGSRSAGYAVHGPGGTAIRLRAGAR